MKVKPLKSYLTSEDEVYIRNNYLSMTVQEMSEVLDKHNYIIYEYMGINDLETFHHPTKKDIRMMSKKIFDECGHDNWLI